MSDQEQPDPTNPYTPPGSPPPPPGVPSYQPGQPGYDQPGQGYQPYGTPPPGGFQGGYPGGAVPGVKIPGQIDPVTGLPYSDKEKLTAGLLALLPLLAGVAGVGRLYTGHMAIGLVMVIGTVTGLVMTCLLIGFLWWAPIWIWGLIDGILMLTNQRFTDANGRVLR